MSKAQMDEPQLSAHFSQLYHLFPGCLEEYK